MSVSDACESYEGVAELRIGTSASGVVALTEHRISCKAFGHCDA